MEKLNGIIYNGKVYIPEETKKPCENCDLKTDCQHGMLVGRACSVFLNENERFRYSQSLTDKLNGK